MDPQRRCNQQQSRRERRHFCTAEVSLPLERRQRPSASRRLPIVVQSPHANPVVKRLKGQMQIFIGLQFDDHESAVAVQGQQVKQSAVAA